MQKFLIIVNFIIFVQQASAQIYSSDTIIWKTSINLQASMMDGLFQQRSALATLKPGFGNKYWSSENEITYRYSDANQRVFADNWFFLSIFRMYLQAKQKYIPFLVANLENNFLYKLESRQRYGLGLAYQPFMKSRDYIKVGILSLFDYGKFLDSVFENSNTISDKRNMIRMGLQLSGKLSLLNDNVSMSLDSWLLQSLEERSDFVYRVDIEATFKMTNIMSFVINYKYTYENVYLRNLKPFDLLISIGIKANYKH